MKNPMNTPVESAPIAANDIHTDKTDMSRGTSTELCPSAADFDPSIIPKEPAFARAEERVTEIMAKLKKEGKPLPETAQNECSTTDSDDVEDDEIDFSYDSEVESVSEIAMIREAQLKQKNKIKKICADARYDWVVMRSEDRHLGVPTKFRETCATKDPQKTEKPESCWLGGDRRLARETPEWLLQQGKWTISHFENEIDIAAFARMVGLEEVKDGEFLLTGHPIPIKAKQNWWTQKSEAEEDESKRRSATAFATRVLNCDIPEAVQKLAQASGLPAPPLWRPEEITDSIRDEFDGRPRDQWGQSVPDIRSAASWLEESYDPPEQILENTIDKGCKMAVIAGSKQRKTFFVMQWALCLVAGRTKFLAWNIPKPRKVLIVQMEITENHYHKRLKDMARKMGISSKELDNLHVMNGRYYKSKPVAADRHVPWSTTSQKRPQSLVAQEGFLSCIKRGGYDLIILDPLYKLIEGDENSAGDIKPVLSMFDRICEESGAALAFVHHNPKGRAGDRQTVDRGAGSGVLARDFDAAIYLTDHSDNKHQVVETIVRCYKPQKPFTMGWDENKGILQHYPKIDPEVSTSKNANQRPKVTKFDIMQVIAEKGPLTLTQLRHKMESHGTKKSFDVAKPQALKEFELEEWKEPGKNPRTYIGTPEQIGKLKDQEATEVCNNSE